MPNSLGALPKNIGQRFGRHIDPDQALPHRPARGAPNIWFHEVLPRMPVARCFQLGPGRWTETDLSQSAPPDMLGILSKWSTELPANDRQARRHDAGRRSDPRQRGPGRSAARRPIYVDLLPPCNNACPAGENIQAWLEPGAGGQVPRGLGNAGARQPDAGGAWPGLLSPLRNRLQSRRARRAGQHPRGRALSRRSRDAGGLAVQGRGARRAASACWWSAPARADCRPPIISRAWATRSRSTRRDRCPAA